MYKSELEYFKEYRGNFPIFTLLQTDAHAIR